MTIHLRSVLESNGDTVDYCWYCSEMCWRDSLISDPPEETFKRGGAYPCGAEHDSADYCATCGAPVGNPLTPEGEEYVKEFVAEVAGELFPASLYSLPKKFAGETQFISIRVNNARMLLSEYSYLFKSDNV